MTRSGRLLQERLFVLLPVTTTDHNVPALLRIEILDLSLELHSSKFHSSCSFSSIATILHNARQLPFSQEHNTLIDRADNGTNWYCRQLINLRGEDTEALSTVSDGQTLYEIRRTFGGLSELLMRRIVDVTV